ncbi:DUF1289 domain-containing protein [Spongiibacter pelagi]|uniref:DUF1289 domain-containing protein n=1 Tax=Spongiibacter pelagi TaxID=2760804 RepID=UPI001CC231E4|nr:DUF1289 domain-containing protein [Spongiibacter pelagi]
MSSAQPRVLTPCIGVCSTGIGDDVCRGCKRFCHEVIHWNSYSEEQKQLIDQRLDGFLVQVMADKLVIDNPDLLEWQLQIQRVRYRNHKDPYIWLFQLLKAGAGQIGETRQYGFTVRKPWRELSLHALRELIDQEFYRLSKAHYQRYIGMYLPEKG